MAVLDPADRPWFAGSCLRFNDREGPVEDYRNLTKNSRYPEFIRGYLAYPEPLCKALGVCSDKEIRNPERGFKTPETRKLIGSLPWTPGTYRNRSRTKNISCLLANDNDSHYH